MLLINDLTRESDAVRREVAAAVQRVLDRGWYVLGPEVEAWEREWASYCGVRHCAGVANGTDALELALRAVGVGPGRRVATVANAGMYSTVAILHCGATPVYIEVDDEMNMEAEALARADADAAIATHLYGRMADMRRIMHVAEARGMTVIEDCAQAHGAVLDGREAGSWGKAACFSFYPTKNLGCIGDGGAVVTDDEEVVARVRALRQYGWTAKYTATEPGGRNSRLDEAQAAVLRAKLPFLDGWNMRRREIAALYRELLPNTPERSGGNDVAHLFVLRTSRRSEIQAALREEGIATDVHYPVPDYHQRAVPAEFRPAEPLAITEACCREVLTLPCFPEMSDSEVRRVAEAFRTVVTRVGARESK